VAKANAYEFREEWLQAALGQLRPYFRECGFELPEKIRFAIAFPSTGRKGNRLGETWHPKSSGDGTWEIILRNDLFDPVDILGVQMNKLVHTVIADDASHGRKFRAAAVRVGLSGKIHKAEPGPLLIKRLAEIADRLGPLPHAALNIQDNPMTTRPIERSSKKRGGIRLKAECLECAGEGKPYIVRIFATSARDPGPPLCPKHGAMKVEWPAEEEPPDKTDSDSAAK
jgi:hypothetical protein